jgi:hypothetical protein
MHRSRQDTGVNVTAADALRTVLHVDWLTCVVVAVFFAATLGARIREIRGGALPPYHRPRSRNTPCFKEPSIMEES